MTACRACGGQQTRPAVDLGEAPALVGALFDDASRARAAVRGRLELAVCDRCGHVQNEAFDPALVEYDVDYDNSLHHSPTFRRYAEALAARLVDERGIRGRHVVEIGSGKGDFLAAVCADGANRGTGYDPTVDPALEISGVRLVADYFVPGQDVEPYDLLVCRHVLEHLDDPLAMLTTVRGGAADGALLYLEVPSAEFNFGPEGMWDSIYPHVSYFSAESLDALVRRAGYEVVASGDAFEGQFLWVEARPAEPDATAPEAVDKHLRRVEEFGGRWAATTRRWREEIAARPTGEVALWGAGAKGVTVLNAVDPRGALTVVDLNPNKWGRFLPGTGHEVRAPDALAGTPVRTVLITNPVYRDEISDHLQQIGVRADVVGL